MNSATADCQKLALSINEACRASSLGRTTIYGHIAAGRLKAVRIDGRTVIPADSLRTLIAGEGHAHRTAMRWGVSSIKSRMKLR